MSSSTVSNIYATGPKERKTDNFYLTPLKKPRDDGVWYCITPIGHNLLSQTVKRLCQVAGISGFKTNHSLRVTSATRLFQSGLDEQLIMSRTGHRSVEGYECTRELVRNKNNSYQTY